MTPLRQIVTGHIRVLFTRLVGEVTELPLLLMILALITADFALHYFPAEKPLFPPPVETGIHLVLLAAAAVLLVKLCRRVEREKRAFLQEIATRQQAEQALAQQRRLLDKSQRKLTLLVEQTPIAIIEWTNDFRVLSWNPAAERIFGYSAAEVLGKSGLEGMVPVEQHQQVGAVIEKMRRERVPVYSVNDNITKDARLITCEWYNVPLIENGEVIGQATMALDITERRRVEEQAIQLELERERVQLLSNFITDVSHDFRTPLSVLNTSLYLLRRTSDPERQRERINAMETQVARLEKLLDQLLLMATLDSLNQQLFAPLNLESIMRSVYTSMGAAAERKGLRFEFALEGNLPAVHGHEVYLHRALQNLVENALEHTQTGSVSLRANVNGGTVCVQVEDTGSGISPEDLPHIFERFYRGDKARSVETGGAGLGLSIAKRIIELHQGTIEMVSKPGEGSLFTIVLPSVASSDTYTPAVPNVTSP